MSYSVDRKTCQTNGARSTLNTEEFKINVSVKSRNNGLSPSVLPSSSGYEILQFFIFALVFFVFAGSSGGADGSRPVR